MKRLLILIVLAAVVWGAFYLQPEEEVEAPLVELGEWSTWSMEGLSRLAFQAPGFSYVLLKDGEGFVVELPKQDVKPPADTAKIETLLDFISGNAPIRRLGRFDAPETFGLDVPQISLSINEGFVLDIGDQNPSRDGVYAEINKDGELVLLAGDYLERLNKNADEYFDLKLTDVRVDELGGIRLEAAEGETWELFLDKGRWAFAAPQSLTDAPVSSSDVEVYLHQALNLRAAGLLLNLEAPETEPLLQLTLKDEAGEELDHIALFDMFESGFVGTSKRLPALFSLSADTMGMLTKSSFSLKDRRIVDLDTGKIVRVDLHGGEQELTFKKEGQAWKGEGNGSEEALTGIDMLMWRLTDLKYESDPVESLPEGMQEMLGLSFFHEGDEQVKSVTFYAEGNGDAGVSFLRMDGAQLYYPVADDVWQDYQRLLPPEPIE
jgi:hypothetical protein